MSLLLLLFLTSQSDSSLRFQVEARIARAPARAVGVYYRDLATGDSLTVGSAVRFHAASTMKIPVMIQLFRDRDAGLLSLDDSITITNTFRSIVDSSPYLLDVTDDSDSSLYKRLGRRASRSPSRSAGWLRGCSTPFPSARSAHESRHAVRVACRARNRNRP